MKNIIPLILVLFLSSCALKKQTVTKDNSEYTFVKITEHFDSKKSPYIGLKKYCVGGVQIDKPNKEDCPNCFSEYDIYIFWSENGNSFIKKFDNCSEFNTIEISSFNPIEYLKINSAEIKTEKVGRFKVKEDTYSSVSHSCFRNYIINDGETKYQNEFDNYDLTGEIKNLNYHTNNELKIIMLDKKLDKIITDLEKENRFERDRKTCYNTSINAIAE